MSKGLEKYLQDAEQCHALEVNYFNDNARCASEELNLEDAEQHSNLPKVTKYHPNKHLLKTLL